MILRLLLGDQLNLRHSWFNTVDDHVLYVLMEVRQETDDEFRPGGAWNFDPLRSAPPFWNRPSGMGNGSKIYEFGQRMAS